MELTKTSPPPSALAFLKNTKVFFLCVIVVIAGVSAGVIISHYDKPVAMSLRYAIGSVQAVTAPASYLSFQGQLLDSSNQPVTGTYTFNFSLWSDSSSTAKTYHIYCETESITLGVYGVFYASIGSGAACAGLSWGESWPPSFSVPYYLQIIVGADTLTPRIPLTASPYLNEAACPTGAFLSGVSPMICGQLTTGSAIDVYVDLTSGSDITGDGSAAHPFLTIQTAINSLPLIVTTTTYIDISDGSSAEALTLAGHQVFATLIIRADMLGGGHMWGAGTATSGTANSVTVSTANYPVNAYVGGKVWVRYGTGAGQIATIASNTATTITIVGTWTAPASGSRFDWCSSVVMSAAAAWRITSKQGVNIYGFQFTGTNIPVEYNAGSTGQIEYNYFSGDVITSGSEEVELYGGGNVVFDYNWVYVASGVYGLLIQSDIATVNANVFYSVSGGGTGYGIMDEQNSAMVLAGTTSASYFYNLATGIIVVDTSVSYTVLGQPPIQTYSGCTINYVVPIIPTQETPTNPTGTVSTAAYVMMGVGTLGGSSTLLGFVTSDNAQGDVVLSCNLDVANSGAGDGIKLKLAYGTGAAPANGAAATGTVIGPNPTYISTAAGQLEHTSFTQRIQVGSPTVMTAYWVDFQVEALTAGTASISNINCIWSSN